MADAEPVEDSFDIYDYWAECRRDQPVGRFGGDGSDIWLVTQLRRRRARAARPQALLEPGQRRHHGAGHGDGDPGHGRRGAPPLPQPRGPRLPPLGPGPLGERAHRPDHPPAHRRPGRAHRAPTSWPRSRASSPSQVIAGVLGVPSEDHERFHAWALDMNKGPEDYPVSMAASARHARSTSRPSSKTARCTPPTTSSPTSSRPRWTASASATSTSTGSSACCSRPGPRPPSPPWAAACSPCSSQPDVLDRVRADPSLLDAVIEETLRWETSVTMVNRETTCPVEIDGVTVPQGRVARVRHRLGQSRRVPLRRSRQWDLDRHEPAPHRLRHRAPPVPGHAPGPHGAARRPRRPARAPRRPALRRPAAGDGGHPVRIEGLAFRSPPRLPVVFDSVAGPAA